LAHLDRKALEAEIQSAFHGVVLGNGISLGQAQVIDRTGDGFSDEQLAALIPDREVKDDWSQIPFEELDSDCIPRCQVWRIDSPYTTPHKVAVWHLGPYRGSSGCRDAISANDEKHHDEVMAVVNRAKVR